MIKDYSDKYLFIEKYDKANLKDSDIPEFLYDFDRFCFIHTEGNWVGYFENRCYDCLSEQGYVILCDLLKILSGKDSGLNTYLGVVHLDEDSQRNFIAREKLHLYEDISFKEGVKRIVSQIDFENLITLAKFI